MARAIRIFLSLSAMLNRASLITNELTDDGKICTSARVFMSARLNPEPFTEP